MSADGTRDTDIEKEHRDGIYLWMVLIERHSAMLYSYKNSNYFNYYSFQKDYTYCIFSAFIKSIFNIFFCNLCSYSNMSSLERKHPHT